MSDTGNSHKKTGPAGHEDFDAAVDRCLAMILHYAEVQEIAALVKRVHADKLQGTRNEGRDSE